MVRLFALDPCPDVRRTVAKRYPVAFARAQEPNSVSVYEDDILEIQHDRPARRFRSQHSRQFAEAVRVEATAQGQHHVAICLALDLQHLGSAMQESNREASAKLLNLEMLELALTDRDFANW